MEDIGIKITIDSGESKAELKGIKQGLDELNTSSKSASNAISTFAHSLQSIIGTSLIIDRLKDYAFATIQLNKSYENLKIGITSLIAVNSANISSTGRVLDAANKWQLALKDSENTLKALNKTNQKTKFSLDEIASAFRMFYAVSADQAGGIRKAEQAMDSIALAAQATGKDLSALVPMMDSLAKGTVIAASEMGQFMNAVGLSNEELKKANEAGRVYDYIIERLSKFKDLSDEAAKSYEVSLSVVKNEFNELLRELGKPMFDKASAGLAEFAKYVKENKADLLESAKTALEFSKTLGKIALAYGALKLASLTYHKAASLAFSLAPLINAQNAAALNLASRLNLSAAAAKGLSVAFNLASTAATALKRAMLGFLPVAGFLALGEAIGFIADKLGSAKASAEGLSGALNRTKEQIAELTQAQKELAKLNINKQLKANEGEIYELNHKLRVGSFGIFKLSGDDATVARARIDELKAQNRALQEQLSLYNNIKSVKNEPEKLISSAQGGVDNGLDKMQKLAEYARFIDRINLSFLDEYEARIYKLKQESTAMLEAGINKELVSKFYNSELSKIKADRDKFEKDQEEKEAQKQAREQELKNRKEQEAKERAKRELETKLQTLSEIGRAEEAWQYKLAELTQKLKENEFLSQSERFKILSVARDKFYEQAKKKKDEFEKDFIKSQNSYSKAISYTIKQYQKDLPNAAERGFELASKGISSLQSGLERFFDFGSDGFLKLGELGKSIFRDIANTLIRQNLTQPLTAGIASAIGGFFGGGGDKDAILNIAASLGLKAGKNGNFSGKIGDSDVEISATGDILKGVEALKGANSNIFGKAMDGLSALNTAKSLYGAYQGGLEAVGSAVATPFHSVGEFLIGHGFANAGAFASGMGAGAYGFMTGLNGIAADILAAGGAGSGVLASGVVAGSAMAGAGVGGAIGALGDLAFGAKTKASTGGMIGGALGGTIGALASIPYVGWALAGLGALIGGAMGRWKVSQQGIAVRGEEDLTYRNGKFEGAGLYNWTEQKKKSWYGSDTKSEYANLDNTQSSAINKSLKATNLLIDSFAKSDKIRIMRANYGGNDLINQGLTMGALEAITGESVPRWGVGHFHYEQFKKEAELTKKELYETFAQYATTVKKSLHELKALAQNNPAKIALNELMEANKVFKSIAPEFFNGAFEAFSVDLLEFRQRYKEAIQNSFTPETINAWQEAKQALEAARKAQLDYTKALIEFKAQVAGLASNFYANRGLNTGAFNLMASANKISELSKLLSFSLSNGEKDFLKQNGGISSANAWNKFISSFDYQSLQHWLGSGESELKKELMGAINEYNQSIKNGALTTPAIENLKQINKQIADAKLAQNAQKFKDNLSASLDILNRQYSALNRLKDMARSLRGQADNTVLALGYNKALKEARIAYENGDSNSRAYADLQAAANAREAQLKISSATYEEYKLGTLKIANEIEEIGGGADIMAIKLSITRLENQLISSTKDVNAGLDGLLQMQANFMQQASSDANEIARLLGEDNPVTSYLRDMIRAINNQTQAILKSSDTDAKIPTITTPDLPAYVSKPKQTITANGAVLKDETDRIINKIYLDLFGRSVEQDGLNHWRRDMLREGWDAKTAAGHIAYAGKLNLEKANMSIEEWNKKYGFKPFADGGIVTRPTRALIGEAGYAEAIIPLKNGAGLKIDAGGAFTAMLGELRSLNSKTQRLERSLDDSAKYLQTLNAMFKNVTNLEGSALLMQGAMA